MVMRLVLAVLALALAAVAVFSLLANDDSRPRHAATSSSRQATRVDSSTRQTDAPTGTHAVASPPPGDRKLQRVVAQLGSGATPHKTDDAPTDIDARPAERDDAQPTDGEPHVNLEAEQRQFFNERLEPLADEIGLDDDTQSQLRTLFGSQAHEIVGLIKGRPLEPDERTARLNQIRWRYTDRVRLVMSPDQFDRYMTEIGQLGIFGPLDRNAKPPTDRPSEGAGPMDTP